MLSWVGAWDQQPCALSRHSLDPPTCHQRCSRAVSLSCCSQFGQEGPFWGRSYVFWHDGRPLTIIYEVFSPRLQDYLGPWQTEIQT